MNHRHDNTTSEHPLSSTRPQEALKPAHGQHAPSNKQWAQNVNVRLEVRYADLTLGGVPVRLRAYNGALPGPVIEARPGDTLNIFLDNQLPEDPNPGSDDPNQPHGFNITNLHFHGMHVSPTGNSDNVLMAVRPGQQFHYEVKIPFDHPAGTYWYHPHKHGSVAIQIANGLAGALIIRGNIDEVKEIKEARERIFVFQQIPYVIGNDGIGRVETYDNFPPGKWAELGRRVTINGQVEPTYRMRPGEVQRWRFIYAGLREPLNLKLVKRGHSVKDPDVFHVPQYQIALDGITTGRLEQVAQTEVYPGYRVDVLVRAAGENGKELPEGEYWLVDATETDPTKYDDRRYLARIVVKGEKSRMKLPKEKDLAPLAPFKNIEDSELTNPGHPQLAHFNVDLSTGVPIFTINGKPFNPHAPPRELKLGAVEEWLVSSNVAGHPFHMHVNPFQYTRADGTIVWKDTLFIPQGTTDNPIRLRTRYERYIGQFMLHCHILEHEDRGMMETMEILPPSRAHEHPDHGPH
jgi:FtsP/CotA-like multicopper oxidase with cupredoxin domain